MRELDNLKQNVIEDDVDYLNEKAQQFVIRINSQIEQILKEQQLFCDPQVIDSNELAFQDGEESDSFENLTLEDCISDSKNRLQNVQVLQRDLIDLHAAFNKLASLVWVN